MLKGVGIEDINEEYSVEKVDLDLKAKFREFWKTKLFDDERKENQGNNLRRYRDFKTIFEMETYLTHITEFNECKALTKLRVSNHNLIIEKGRHQRLPIERRLCNKCNVIENEEHFLTQCEKNKNLRDKLYEEIIKDCHHFSNLEPKEKMIYMLSQTDEAIMRHIGKFVDSSFKLI